MGKLNKDTGGFAALEIVLIVVIVAILGFTGWYVYSANKKASATLSSASKDGSGPVTYAKKSTAVKTKQLEQGTIYTSKLGGFNVNYPTTWSIAGYTDSTNKYVKASISQLNGSESTILITSSNAMSNSFGEWLSVNNNASSTSSLNSALTQISYSQGSVVKTLPNGIGIWQANQNIVTNGHSNSDTCIAFETVSNGSFGYKLNNGKYFDASMSFCYAQGQTTTNTYTQQANSSELQQATNIVSSLKQN
jgi:hypothetical protein